ncbi:MAG: hypothetical protein DME84_08015 [Verrucomicrobia bacterium]|nr:MAG: hypothetical protein DME84_08015 [Verrucomicrobiota bacterium]
MNHVVEGGWLTPALVTPVDTGRAPSKHAGKVTGCSNARSGKAGADVRLGPAIAAIGGPIKMVDVVVRKTATSFIHARDVHSAVGKVAGDLDIADERARGSQLSLGPGGTVVSREADLEVPSDGEVVPGNVHVSKEGRRWIVVGPARLAVVTAATVNARANCPGDPTVRRLPGADALPAAARSQKNCKESAGRFVVESNRVAKVCPVSTCEWAWVEASPGGAAVAGVRCAGVVGGGGSGIVVGDDDLVGVIRVGEGVRLRLGRVGNAVRTGD